MTTAEAPMSFETKQRPWWLTLINGIAALIIGAVLLWAPAKTKVNVYELLVVMLGFYWLVRGIFDIVYLFVDHTAWGWKLFTGIIGIIAGGTILMYPVAAAVQLPRIFVWVLGFYGLFEGIILLVMAFKGGGWAAGILGALGIIFGIGLLSHWYYPGMGLAFLWTAAVLGVIGGIVLIVRAFQQRSA